MLRILEKNRFCLSATLIVLAWRLGLSREETFQLKWTDFSFEERQVSLPDRCVPLDEVAYSHLYYRWEERGGREEFVASSDRNGERVHPNYIPRCVRKALDEGGLADINMVDLRNDFIIRQLLDHPWPYVVKVSGLAATTLFLGYGQYVQSCRGNYEERMATTQVDDEQIWNVLRAEGDSPEGLALWMSWQMGLSLKDIVALVWEQVDFENDVILLAAEEVRMPSGLKTLLLQVRAKRQPDDDPHVLLSNQARRPIPHERLSIRLRTVMIRGGIENITVVDLMRRYRQENAGNDILSIIKETGKITRNEVMSQLQMSKGQAYSWLNRLVEQKKLVKVGQGYYLPGIVVPPEEQYEVIRNYLEEIGSAYRADFVRLLHLEKRLCGRTLARFVQEGKLAKEGQLYMLPPEKNAPQ